MPAEAVIDASVLGAAFFNEEGSDAARTYLRSAPRLTAPSLIVVEIASLAAKKVRRSEASREVAIRAVVITTDLIKNLVPDATLAPRALELSIEHQISVYDALYVALAERSTAPLLTFDERLRKRIEERKLPIRSAAP